MVTLEKEFSKIIPIDKVNVEPITYKLSASADACKAIADRLGIEEVESLEAEISLRKNVELKAIYVEGRVQASVVQACILSGQPVPEAVDDTFESYYVANSEILENIETQDPAFLYEDIEVLEEPHVNVGELVTQYLSLFLNPYPKKQGAKAVEPKNKGVSLKTEEEAAEEMRQERNPFKALGDLKKN